MSEATRIRLDTVDLAATSGWEVHSTDLTDEFILGGTVIQVQYSAEDEIDDLMRIRPGQEQEAVDDIDATTVVLLRYWLTGQGDPKRESATALPPADFARSSDGWTRQGFIDAVEDPQDRAFLLAILDFVDANAQQQARGSHRRLYFGKRPSGGMFVYPLGRRHPPFKFFAKDGRLTISGCWTGFPEVKGHKGFGELAQLLDLDEQGPATRVPVSGLDPGQVWTVGELVSRAIN